MPPDAVVHHARMRRPQAIEHTPSGDLPKRWLALAPRAWCHSVEALHARLAPLLTSIFAISNEALNHNEPFDANYLGLTSFTARATSQVCRPLVRG